MNNLIALHKSIVAEPDVRAAKMGTRFGRLDLMSQLCVLAVEKLNVNFDEWPRDRIAICLCAQTGSLSTDVEYWQGVQADGTRLAAP
ncbi:MAG: hypothetical protein ABJC04_04095, partial [Verrucomicrobiota bacterium]